MDLHAARCFSNADAEKMARIRGVVDLYVARCFSNDDAEKVAMIRRGADLHDESLFLRTWIAPRMIWSCDDDGAVLHEHVQDASNEDRASKDDSSRHP